MKARFILLLMAQWVLACGAGYASQPQRVVSAGAAVTEIVYALGAQSLLVGVDTQSIYPSEAKELPQVGYVRQLSIEGLASLEPDVLIGAQDVGPAQVLEQLQRMGIPVVVTGSVVSIEQAVARIREVGEALGLAEEGARLAAGVHTRAQAAHIHFAHRDAESAQSPKVAMFLGRGSGSATAAGSDSVGDAMIRLAGGVNAFADMSGFKPVSAEALIAAAPNVVVVTSMMVEQAGSLEALMRSLPGLALTPAAKNGRVVVMDILEMFSFGPRLPEAIARLGAAIHPERADSFAAVRP